MAFLKHRDAVLVNAAVAGPEGELYPRLVKWALGLSPPDKEGDEAHARFLVFGDREGVDEEFLLLCRTRVQHPLKPFLEQLAKQGFASVTEVPRRDCSTRAANFRLLRASFIAQWPKSFASFLAQSNKKFFGFGDDKAAELACFWAILHSAEALGSCQWEAQLIKERSNVNIISSALYEAICAGRLRVPPAQAKVFLEQLVRLLGAVPEGVDQVLQQCFREPEPKTGWDRFTDGELQELAVYSPAASFALGERRLLPLPNLASEVDYLHGVAQTIPSSLIGLDAKRFRTEEDPVVRWALHYAHQDVWISLDPLDEQQMLFALLVGDEKQGVSGSRQEEARWYLHDNKIRPPHEQVVGYVSRCATT